MKTQLVILLSFALFGSSLACLGSGTTDDSTGDANDDTTVDGDGDNGSQNDSGNNGGGGGCDKGAKFDEGDCNPSGISGKRGELCCNEELGMMIEDVMDSVDDLMAAAEELREQCEEKFGCEWECQVSDDDFGHANYMVHNKYCKRSKGNKFGICYRNA